MSKMRKYPVKTIQKTNPLVLLSTKGLSLQARKLMDLYVSYIDWNILKSIEREDGTYDYDKLTYEDITLVLPKSKAQLGLGTARLKKDLLKSYLLELTNNAYDFSFGDDRIINIANIMNGDYTKAYQDKDGSWKISLCSSKAFIPFFFEKKKLGGYTNIERIELMKMSTINSYVFYNYLMNHYKHKPSITEWNENIEDFIRRFELPEYYSKWREFRKDFLIPNITIIEDITRYKIEYYPVEATKVERKYTQFHIKIEEKLVIDNETQSPIDENLIDEELKEYAALEQKEKEIAEKYKNDTHIMFLAEAVDNEFSYVQMKKLSSHVNEYIHMIYFNVPIEILQLNKYIYLQSKYTDMNSAEESFEINNRFGYLVAAIQKDIEQLS